MWFFLIYSVLGWGIGTAAAAIRKRRFIDVEFLYGPWCSAYGVGGVAFAVLLSELRNNIPFLFLGGMIVAFLVTYTTGGMLEYVFHRKWWDYSRKRFQFGGHVNLPYVIIWGVAAIGSICFFNPLLMRGIAMLPRWIGDILLPIIYLVLILDFIGTISGVLAAKTKLRKSGLIGAVSESLQKLPKKPGEIGTWILIVFMVFNMMMSGLALGRYTERNTGKEKAENKIEEFLDDHFPDERMERIYPNAKVVE